ncbi:MAG: hypothetical protein ACOC6G_02550 [Thermoproteota archaeon]
MERRDGRVYHQKHGWILLEELSESSDGLHRVKSVEFENGDQIGLEAAEEEQNWTDEYWPLPQNKTARNQCR